VEPSTPTRDERALKMATLVVVACAISAGAHAGLIPAHLEEAPGLGDAFVAAVILLAAAAIALALHPQSARAARAASLVLAGLISAYIASRTTGIPALSPEPEAVDPIGLTTNVVQALGLAISLKLSQTTGGRLPPTPQEATPSRQAPPPAGGPR
jgi:hypothetical protein